MSHLISDPVVNTRILVQTQDFDFASEYQRLRADTCQDGGIACFSGLVRDMNFGDQVSGLYLEHYPGMTETALDRIAQESRSRWPANHRICIIHRVGQLNLGEQIVFVGVSSPHRQDAFDACQFIMDYLKTDAPFWKKETLKSGNDRWIEPREQDQNIKSRWQS